MADLDLCLDESSFSAFLYLNEVTQARNRLLVLSLQLHYLYDIINDDSSFCFIFQKRFNTCESAFFHKKTILFDH